MLLRSVPTMCSRENPELCEIRGYHGPFEGLEKYELFPGWFGVGDCAVCGSTLFIPAEEARRDAVLHGEGHPPRPDERTPSPDGAREA